MSRRGRHRDNGVLLPQLFTGASTDQATPARDALDDATIFQRSHSEDPPERRIGERREPALAPPDPPQSPMPRGRQSQSKMSDVGGRVVWHATDFSGAAQGGNPAALPAGRLRIGPRANRVLLRALFNRANIGLVPGIDRPCVERTVRRGLSVAFVLPTGVVAVPSRGARVVRDARATRAGARGGAARVLAADPGAKGWQDRRVRRRSGRSNNRGNRRTCGRVCSRRARTSPAYEDSRVTIPTGAPASWEPARAGRAADASFASGVGTGVCTAGAAIGRATAPAGGHEQRCCAPPDGNSHAPHGSTVAPRAGPPQTPRTERPAMQAQPRLRRPWIRALLLANRAFHRAIGDGGPDLRRA